MAKRPLDYVAEDGEALPTDGMDVDEARDDDTAQLFMREWRRRMIRERASADGTADGPDHVPAQADAD